MTNATEDMVVQVMEDNYELLQNHPDTTAWGPEFFPDDSGDPESGRWGLWIGTAKRSDQSKLPPEQRIPDCLDGIPVRWEESVQPEFMGDK